AVITGPLSLRNEQERLRGYRQALQKSGISVPESLVWNGSFEQDQVARLCQNGMLRPSGRPTALFATNGVTGLAALRSLYSIGLSTPRDFAFVTFDEITAEDFFQPGISSVVQPTFDMGYRAVEVLLERIEEGSTEGDPRRVHLPATLTVRESSGDLLDLSASHPSPASPKKTGRRTVAAAR
ncbi:MAG TPA: substrate-binding domain-containing protein, partial [Edaphobacter sp.]|nr:substrate-binding domain-containing protein [Edaphobacter sp.]